MYAGVKMHVCISPLCCKTSSPSHVTHRVSEPIVVWLASWPIGFGQLVSVLCHTYFWSDVPA